MPTGVKDKNSEAIEKGDSVWTPFRGGKREGKVEKVVRFEREAKEEGVKNPPKVTSSSFKSPDFYGHQTGNTEANTGHVYRSTRSSSRP